MRTAFYGMARHVYPFFMLAYAKVISVGHTWRLIRFSDCGLPPCLAALCMGPPKGDLSMKYTRYFSYIVEQGIISDRKNCS